MIDYKYHIASLVAIFLSLGIGILIGSTMLDNNALIDYQKQVTDGLETQLQTLRKTNEELQVKSNALESEAVMHKQFEKQMLPILAENRLTGKHFAIIQLNRVGFPPELADIIYSAGGDIKSVTSMHNINDEKKAIADFQEELNWPVKTEDELYKTLGVEISQYIATGANQSTIDYLTEKELLKTEGEYGVPVDGLIIVGGSYLGKNRNLQIDIAVIDYFGELNLPMVGVEETDVLVSSVKEYQLKHISTVDNIDTAPGLMAMVLVLGGQSGNYGSKATAQQIMPEWPDFELEE